MGPGGYVHGFDNDVPHFDQSGHYRTHSEIERSRHRARRKRTVRIEEAEAEAGSVSSLGGFVMVCGVLATILAVPVGIGAVIGRRSRRVEDV